MHNVNLFVAAAAAATNQFDKDPILRCYLLPMGYAGGDIVNVSFRPSQVPKNGELWQPQKVVVFFVPRHPILKTLILSIHPFSVVINDILLLLS